MKKAMIEIKETLEEIEEKMKKQTEAINYKEYKCYTIKIGKAKTW